MLSLSGCHRAEALLYPDAEIELRLPEGTVTVAKTKAGVVESFSTPSEGHKVTIRAAGHASVVGDFHLNENNCSYATTANAICPNADESDRRRHPIVWLRGESGPFTLPPPGQGIVVTTDRTGVKVTVSPDDPSGPAIGRYEAERAGRPLPVVVPLEANVRYRVYVGKEGKYYPHSEDVRVTAGEYRWIHAMIGTRTSGEGGSFIR